MSLKDMEWKCLRNKNNLALGENEAKLMRFFRIYAMMLVDGY